MNPNRTGSRVDALSALIGSRVYALSALIGSRVDAPCALIGSRVHVLCALIISRVDALCALIGHHRAPPCLASFRCTVLQIYHVASLFQVHCHVITPVLI